MSQYKEGPAQMNKDETKLLAPTNQERKSKLRALKERLRINPKKVLAE